MKNGVYVICVLILLCASCKVEQNENKISTTIDMESVSNDLLHYKNQTIETSGEPSAEVVFKGKYSWKLKQNKGVAFKLLLDEIETGDIVKLSVWVFEENNSSEIVLTSKGSFYKNSSDKFEDKEGWRKMEISMVVPEKHRDTHFLIRTKSNTQTYIDELKIDIIRRVEPELSKRVKHFNLILSSKDKKKLTKKRNIALKNKVLITKKEDWVTGLLAIDNDTFKIKARLKGDWTDHLSGNKWSYRIKVLDNSFKGNPIFSIQAPQARGFLYEWVFQKMLERENILTSNYQLIQFSEGDKFLGIYAKEDYFTNQYITAQGFDSSVVLKFNEDELWQLRKENPNKYSFPYYIYESSEIEPFDKKTTLESKKLHNEYLKGRSKLYKYQIHRTSVDEVFEINKLSLFVAITDLTRSYHTLFWHNKRFYYNPILEKLEPVGFDGYYGENPYKWSGIPFLGVNGNLIRKELSDTLFSAKYLNNLKNYFDQAYLDEFIADIKAELEFNIGLIQEEYPAYSFDLQYLYVNDSIIKNALHENKYKINLKKTNEQNMVKTVPVPKDRYRPVKNISLKCYLEWKDSVNLEYTVVSFYPYKINLERFCDKKLGCQDIDAVLPRYAIRSEPIVKKILLQTSYSHIYYRGFEGDSICKTKIINRPPPF